MKMKPLSKTHPSFKNLQITHINKPYGIFVQKDEVCKLIQELTIDKAVLLEKINKRIDSLKTLLEDAIRHNEKHTINSKGELDDYCRGMLQAQRAMLDELLKDE